jgi:hypothetical protein
MARLAARKVDFEYETKKLEYTLVRRYRPDIILAPGHNDPIYIECKGYLRATDRTILKACLKAGHDIRLLFQRDNKLNARTKTRYSAWAERNGFKWAIGEEVPEEWVKEAANRMKRSRSS